MTNRVRKTVKSLLCRQTRPKKYYRGAHDGYLLPRDDIADSLIPLEPRCMFDAAGFVTGAENLADQVAETQADAAVAEAMNPDATHNDAAEAETSALFAALGPATSSEVVFIDSRVDDFETLIAGIDSDAQVVILDAESDGIAQIANTLEGREGLTAIHIVSHGEAGELLLGDSVFNQDSIDGQHADALESISRVLSADADVLIYGCNFGEGEIGLSAMQAFADATGADVAASDDLTGAAELGGDWKLEATVGVIENGVIVNAEAMAAFNGVLATTLDWSDYTADPQFPPVLDGSAAAVVTEGGVQVSFSVDTDLDGDGNDTAVAGQTGETIAGVRGGLTDYFQMYSNGASNSAPIDTQLYVISFDTVVNNLTFTLSDIDSSLPQFQDQLQIQAFNGATAVDLTAAEVTLVSAWDGVSAAGVVNFNDGTNTFLGRGGQNIGSGANQGNATIAFTSAIDRIEITYSQGPAAGDPSGNQAVGIHDMTWQADPNAVDDSIQTDEGTSVSQIASGVIANDELNSETGALVITELNGNSGDIGAPTVLGSGATLTLGGDGSYTYDPTTSSTLNALSAGETAFDTFIYTLDDGVGGSDTATVTVTVTGLNDAPTANPDAVTLSEDQGATVLDLVGNDTDPDTNDILSVGGIDTTGTSGSVSVNNGTVSYDPSGQFDFLAPGQSAVDSFTYTVTDGNGGTDTATVTITVTGVNDAPIAVDDAPIFGEEDGASILDVLGNDSDPEGDTVTLTAVDPSGAAGAVSFSNGTVSYDPNGQFDFLSVGATAVDSFTYTVTDGNGGTDVATVNITITGANDLPDAIDDSAAFNKDGGASVVDVLSNDTDPDTNDVLTVASIDTSSTTGTVMLAGGTVSYDPNGQFPGLGAGQTAIDTFTYTVTDSNGGTDVATVSVIIGGDEIVAVDDSGKTDEDTVLSVPAGGVLANDVDTLIPTPVTTGLRINLDASQDSPADDGTWENLVGSTTDEFFYNTSNINSVTPTTNFPGITSAYSFDGTTGAFYDADSDGSDNSFGDGAAGIAENADGSFEIWFKPNDLSGTEVLFETGGNGSDALAIYMVDNVLKFVVHDQGRDTAVLTFDLSTIDTTEFVQVVGVFDEDTGSGDTAQLYVNGALRDSSSGDDIRDWSSGNDAALGSFTGSSIVEQIEGIGSGAVGDFAGELAIFRFYESNALSASEVTQNFDAITSTLSVTGITDPVTSGSGSIGSPFALDSGAEVTLNSDGSYDYDPNGQFEFLAAGETALDTFTYEVSDGTNTSTATVVVTVCGVNDLPTAVDDNVTVGEDDAATIVDLVGNDNDPDSNDTLTVNSVDATGTTGSVNLVGGTVSYNPSGQFESLAVGETAIDSFTYTMTDGNGGTDTATVNVTINGQNDLPDAVDDTSAVSEDGLPVTIDLTGNDTDPDTSDDLEILSIDTTGTSGTVTVDADNDNVTYNPNGQFESLAFGETAVDTFTYTVSDGNDGTDVATVTVTINGQNDLPDAVDDTSAVSEDGLPVTIDLTGNDTDPDTSDDLEILSIDTTGTSGTVTIDADNDNVTYNPNGQFESLAFGETAVDTFTYTVSDGNGGTDVATVTVTINGQNDLPDAVDDTSAVSEDGLPVTIDLTGNDTDPDTSDDLEILSIDTTGTSGTVTIDADNDNVTYNPNGQFESLAFGETAVDTFTYTVSDGNGGTDVATVTVTINGQNDLPDAVDDTSAVSEDGLPVTIDLTGNDTDPDTSDDLEILSIDTTGTSGTVTIDADNDNVTYNPNGQFESLAFGETAVDTFTYTVSDGNGGTDVATVTVTINGQNDLPDAVDDTSAVSENGLPVTIDLTGNDTDPDGTDDLEILSIDTTGTLGSVSIDPDNDNVTYDPNGAFDSLAAGETALDTFTYTVTDGNGGTDTATVTVTINGQNDLPDAIDDTATVNEDGPAVTIDLTTNDTDLDSSDDLEIQSIDTTGTLGTVSINADNDNVTYDPNGAYDSLAAGETALDTFTYTVTDGNGGTDTATVTVTINGQNDVPVAVNDTATVNEDGPAVTIDLTTNDTDLDSSDDLEIQSIDTTGTLGTVSINADNDNVTYDPNGAFESLAVGETALDTFTYTVTDGNGGTDTATVTVTINGQNDLPDAIDDTATVNEDGPAVTIDLTTNDTDLDSSDDLEIQSIDTTGTLGTVVVNPDNDNVTYDPNGQFESLAVGETALDTFTYTVTDGNGGTDTATVTVTINGQNDVPVAVNDTATVNEDGPAVTIDLTTNDTDLDGSDDLEIQSIDTTGTNGTVSVNVDNDNVTYDPNGQFESLAVGETALDTFTYTVTDGNGGTDTATVTVTINGQNDLPDAIDDTATVNEDGPAVTIDLTTNDTDLDSSDDLEIQSIDTTGTLGTVVVNPDNDNVTYDPNGQFESLAVGETALDTFTYTVTDGNGGTDTATVTVTINGQNDVPVAVNDTATVNEDGPAVTIDLTTNDTDLDGSDDLEIQSIDTTGTNGTVSVNVDNDNVTYDPNGQFESLAVGETALDTFTYTVTDGNGGTDTATVTVTINGQNDLPDAIDDTATVNEDGPAVTIDLTTNDTDLDSSDDLEIQSIDTTGTLGTVSINADNDNVIYDPNGAYDSLAVGETALDTFSYTITDSNGGTDTATVTVTINGQNDLPDAIDDTATVNEDGPAVTIDLTTNDTDLDGSDDLEIQSIDTTGTLGTVSINADNDNVTYDPNGAFESLAVGETALDTFTYTVTDGNGGTDTATVTVTINGQNDVPVAVNDTATVNEDGPAVTIDLTTNDTDLDSSDDLEIQSIDTTGTLGTVVVNPDNDNVAYDPSGQFESLAVGETALDTFTYTVTDGNGGTDTATVTVTINGQNDLPDAIDDTATVNEDGPAVTIDLTTNDTDLDSSDDLEIQSIDTTGTLGTVSINADNDNVAYDPNGQFEGLAAGETALDTFTYTVTDGNGGTDTATVTVTINGQNDVPDAIDDTATVNEDGPAVTIDLTTNDTDLDSSDDLEIQSIDTTGTLGTVSINADNDNVTYDPNGQFEGLAAGETALDTFTYTVTDGNGGTDTATVTVTINGQNDVPDAIDDTATVNEDGPAVTIDLTTNDTDLDSSDDLEIQSIDTTGTNGTVSVNVDNDNVTYDPNGQFESLAVGETALDTFTYTVTDGNGGTDTATVTVTINGQNDLPDAIDDTATVNEDGPAVTIDLTTNDTDLDSSDDIEIQSIDTTGTLGSVSINADNDNVTYDPNGAFESLAAGETALDTFTYTVTDGNGGTDVATVTVTINGQNDVPVAIDDTATVNEDGPAVTIDLTTNDTDLDSSDDLEIQSVDTTGTLGSVSVNADNDNVTYDPNGQFESLAVGETALDTFTYTVTDGNGGTDTATVTVTINGQNDLPDAIDDTATVNEDGPAVTIDLTTNDTDLDSSDDLEIQSIDTTGTLGTVSINADNDNVTYDPNGAYDSLAAGETALDTFTYTVTDGNGGTDTATVTVTINGQNDVPDAIDDTATVNEDGPADTIDLTTNDTDLDSSDDLEIQSIDTTGTLGSAVVNPDNDNVTYNPNGAYDSLAVGETALDTFSYTITDGNGGTDTATVTVTINGQNDAPVAVNDTATVNEDGPAVTIDLTTNDTDPDTSDDLEIQSIDTTGTLGTVVVNPDNDNVTYDPNGQFDSLAAGETALDTFTYTVTDGIGGTDIATVTVTIIGQNDLPDAIDDTATVNEDGPAVTIDLTTNDTDPDGSDDLEIQSIDTTGTLGTVSVNPDNDNVTYNPNGQFEDLAVGETALDTFTYTVSDGNGGTDTATVTVTINGQNDVPVAVNDTATVNEDGPAVTIDLTTNDTDLDSSDDLEIQSIDTTGTLGSVVVNADSDSVTYDPNGAYDSLAAGETALDTFTYTVSDGNGGTDTATVTVTINGQNDVPVAVNDTATVNEDGPAVTIDLTTNDTDLDSTDDLEIQSIDTTGTNGTVVVNADNDSVTYDPNGAYESLAAGETALDTFTYTVSDGNGGTDIATVTVTIIGQNDLPDAIDDTATVNEDGPAVTIDLTTNDTDLDSSDDLEIQSVDTTGTLGSVSVNADNDNVTYDPNGQFESLAVGETALDTFTYTVTDGNGGTDTATVTVTINGQNDLPDAIDDTATVNEDGPAVTIDLTTNDTDLDSSDDLEIQSIDTTGTLGTVVVNPDNDNVTYNPNGQFEDLAVGETALDMFTYTVTDGNGGTDVATVTVTINGQNDVPVAVNDTATVNEDGPAVTIDLTTNDTDLDSTDDLEIQSIDTTGTNGTVVVNADNDSVTYDPNGAYDSLAAGETALDTFTYTVSDGNGGTDIATVTVTIIGQNDLPDAIDDTATVNEDGPAVTIDLTTNDTDLDSSDDLEIQSIDTTGTLGTVSVNPDNDNVTYDPNGAFESLAVGETALDTFTYTVSDGNGGTDTATVTVTINGQNDLPDAIDDTATVNEDGPAVTIDLTTNDTDLDSSDDLEIQSIDTTGTLGTVSINADNDNVTYDRNGAFESLALGETALDTFTYTVTDGNGGTDTATVTVTINGQNDVPVAVNDTATVNEDGPAVTIDLTTNDTDPDTSDDLEIQSIDTTGTLGTVVVDPDNDNVTYDPNGAYDSLAAGETALDTFTYTVTDGNGGTDTATVTVTINGQNDLPDATNDNAIVNKAGPVVSIDLTANDTDPDSSDDLEIQSIDTTGTLGSVTVNPDNDNVTYDPNGQFDSLAAGETALDTFTYTVSDGNGGTDTATVTVTINGQNAVPDAIDDTATVNEDGPAVTIDLTTNDTDPDTSDDLEIQSIDTTGTLGTVVVNPDNDNVTYDPNGQFDSLAAGETALDTFTYTVTDGIGGTDVATVTVTINGQNDVPVAVNDTATVNEDGPAVTIDLTTNDTDPDTSDDLEIQSIDTTGTLGTVVVNPDNDNVTYDPNGQFDSLAAGETALDTFTYTVTDGIGGTDIATVTVTIIGQNDLPDAIDDTATVNEDGPAVTIDLTTNDTDPDGSDDLEIQSIDTTGTLGTVSINADNDNVTYDPNGAFESLAAGETALDTFTYTVTDGNGGTDTATVTVTINGQNDLPDAIDDTATVNEDGPAVTIDLTTNDTDLDGSDDLEIQSIDTTGTLGTVSINADNDNVTYDPNGAFESLAAGETALDTFTYTVTDGNGGTDTATVTVTINGQNDVPVAVNDTATVNEDGPAVTIDLTTNDTDPDTSDDLEIQSIDTTGTLGTVVVNPDNDNVTYDPNGQFDSLAAGETALDTFTYTVTDGIGGTDIATVTVTIIGQNDLPDAIDDTATVNEDGPAVTIDLTTNDTDPDGSDDLEIQSIDTTGTLGTVSVNPDNDNVTYNPNGQFEDLAVGETALDTFTYTVSDGNGGTDTATVTVTINGQNDVPVAVNDTATVNEDGPAVTIDLTTNDTDPDTSDDLEIQSIDTTGTLGTVVVNPDNDNVTYDPNGQFDSLAAGETALDTFTYTVTDGIGGTDIATVTVTIIGQNDLPDAIDDTATVNEDGPAVTIDLTTNDTDPDGSDDLEIQSIDTTGTLGTVSINADNDNVTYDPNGAFESLAAGETALDTFTYTVTDGNGGTDTATVTVTINGQNDLPDAIDDTATVNEDGPAVTIDLTTNDTDLDGSDDLEIQSIDTTGTLGTVSINADNDNVTYDPNGAFESLAAGETALDTFTYTVTDGNGGTDTATVTVTINGQNDVPVAVNDTATVNEDGPAVTIDLTTNDTDLDSSDDIEIQSIDTTGTLGTVSINADNDNVTYDPNSAYDSLAVGETALDTFSYTITDGNGGTDTATVTVTINGQNDLPDAIDDTATVNEDGPAVTIDLTTNDTDLDSTDDLEIQSIDTTGTLGTVSINADNDNVTYDPNGAFESLAAGETALDTFTYTVTDGNGGTDTATVTVTINGQNDLPDAIDDTATVNEDGPAVTIDLTTNDTDLDGSDDLEIQSIDTTGTLGTVSINADNDNVTYDPNGAFESLAAGETALDTFTYTVTDGNGGTDTATVTVTINGQNDVPVAVNDTATVNEDGPAVTIDLTTNDTDLDSSDDIEIQSIDTTGTLGTVSINADNDNVTYDPNGAYDSLAAGETALDMFTYTVTDGNGGTDVATVTVTIIGQNDLPDAVDDTAVVNEDGPAVTIDLTTNDTDPDSTDDLEIQSIDTTGTLGTVSINADNDNVTYDPNGAFESLAAGETALDTFTYTVTDGNGGTDTATVTVTINGQNDLPDAIDDTATVNEDGPAVTIDLTTNDTDLDSSDDLEIQSIDTTGTLGTVSVNADNDSVTYDPNGAYDSLAAGETALDTFTYTVSDGNGGTDTATVTVTINGQNDLPDAIDDTATVNEDGPAVTIDLTTNDTDLDSSDDIEIQSIDTTGTLGTVSINADNDNVTYDPNGAYDSLAAGETALDTFTYTVSDGNGGTDIATVTVTINGQNDLPDAIDDTATVNEDGPAVTIDLTTNDIDLDGSDDLGIQSIDTTGTNGTVVVNPDNDNVTYDPNGAYDSLAAGETALDTFTYTVSDGNGGTDTATVTVTINGQNDLPDAIDDTATVNEDGPAVTIDLTTNDTDPDGSDDLEIQSIDTTGTSGTVVVNADNDSVTYDPNGAYDSLAAGETALDTFTYTVIDGNGGTDTATVTVTINGQNDLPDAVDDTAVVNEDGPAVTIDLTTNDIDLDGSDDLEIQSIDTTGTNGTVVVNADSDSVTYDPNGAYDSLAAGETALDTFTYTVSDGNGGTDTATVTVTINGQNDVPVAVNDTATVNEDGPAVTIDLTTNDTDPDGSDDLEIQSIDTTGTLGTVSVNPDNDNVTYNPNGQFEDLAVGETALDMFTYTVSDGNGATDTATVNVTITGDNDGPTAVNDGYSTSENVTLNVPIAVGTISNDSDPDASDVLSLNTVPVTDVTNGTLTLNSDGTFSYIPDPGFTGVDSFVYLLEDGNGGTDTATVSITVTPSGVNIPPNAADDNATFGENDGASVIDLIANDFDSDADTLTISSIDTSGTTGSVTFNNGTVSYVPSGQFDSLPVGDTAIDMFTYDVSDGNGGTDTATVNVTITGVNDAPNAISDSYSTAENVTLNVPLSSGIQINDSDVDLNDTLTIDITPVTDVANGALTIAADGSFTYTPDAGFTGTDSFAYRLTDSAGATDIATVTINVTDATDPGGSGGGGPIPDDPGTGTGGGSNPGDPDVLVQEILLQGQFEPLSSSNDPNVGNSPLRAPGAVVDTVRTAGTLHSVDSLRADGAVLDAVRNASPDVFGDLIDANLASLNNAFESQGVQGFSLRLGLPELGGSLSESIVSQFPLRVGPIGDGAIGDAVGDELIIESLVQQNVIYIDIDYDTGSELDVNGYYATLANGEALPEWLKIDNDSGLLIGDVPVDGEKLQLRIEVQLADSSEIVRYIEVELTNGEISEIAERPESEVTGIMPFSSSLASHQGADDAEFDELLNALAND